MSRLIRGEAQVKRRSRWAAIIERPTPPSRYEACGLTLVKSRDGPVECGVYPDHPLPGSVLDYNRMFRRLYAIYDRRFVYNAPALRSRTEREVWDRESPLLTEMISRDEGFAEMEPRMG